MSEDLDQKFIERFRQSHHSIATYFALGYTASKICQLTGKSKRSLSFLYNTPMFRELIAQKSKAIEEEGRKALEDTLKTEFEWRAIANRNLIQAELHIAERLENADLSGELPSLRELNVITADRADRLGFSKHTTVTHTHDFASRLDRAIDRSDRQKQVGKTIEGEVLSIPDFSSEPSTQEVELPLMTESVDQPRSSPQRPTTPPTTPGFAAALKRRFA